MWQLFLKPMIDGVADHFKSKREIKKAETESKIKIIQKSADNVAEWEKLHAEGSQSSWKDEYWTIIFSIPVVLGFIGMEEVTNKGFQALSNMPEWYQYTLVTMVLASFGIRVTDTVKRHLKGK